MPQEAGIDAVGGGGSADANSERQAEAGIDGAGGGTDASSRPQTETGIDSAGGGADANSERQAEAGIDGADDGTEADSEPQAEAGLDGASGGRDAGSPCTVSSPAADIGPGAQGEYRVSLTTPVFVAAGVDVSRFLAAGSGASEIVYFDGTDFVDRQLVPPLERRSPASLSGMPGVPVGSSSGMSDLWSNISDGRVAVMLPSTEGGALPIRQDLMLLDMVRCEVRPTGSYEVWDGTHTGNYSITMGSYSGNLLAFSRFHSTGFPAGVHALAVTVLDTAGPIVSVYNSSAELPMTMRSSPAVSEEVIAWTRLTDSYPNCEIAWQTFAGASGSIPRAACDQAIVVDAGRIVWSDDHVWLFDTGTGQLSQLTTQSSRQQNPSLRGRLVAYEDDRSGDLDVYALDLTTSVETPVFVGPGDQHLLGILRDGIAWWSASVEGIGVFWNPTFTPATAAADVVTMPEAAPE